MHGPDGPSRALQSLVDHVDQYRPFIHHLQAAAPWFDEVGIGWRVNATLGIRSQVLREGRRTRLLTQGRLDLRDPAVVIALILDVSAPMFLPPAPSDHVPSAPAPSAAAPSAPTPSRD
jgi:hypothetical protein